MEQDLLQPDGSGISASPKDWEIGQQEHRSGRHEAKQRQDETKIYCKVF